MRHGLIAWREDELSRAEVEARQARLRAAMAAAGLDALLLYTNFVRPAAVSWATGFTPYWADGLLMVPGEGRPVFATALSKRVGTWMAGVNPTVEIVHGPAPGRLVGERLQGAARVGVRELDRVPGGLFNHIAAKTSADIIEASPGIASERGWGSFCLSDLIN
jgi:Xaa-Pro aminopeptidase